MLCMADISHAISGMKTKDTFTCHSIPYAGMVSQISGVEALPEACRADKTAENVRREVHDNGVDLVLHVGDISYANGVVKIWDTFMRYIEPYASRAPYMIGIGNHEYDYKTGREKSHKHKHHTDASGSEEPYDPDWGNYGEHMMINMHHGWQPLAIRAYCQHCKASKSTDSIGSHPRACGMACGDLASSRGAFGP